MSDGAGEGWPRKLRAGDPSEGAARDGVEGARRELRREDVREAGDDITTTPGKNHLQKE